MTLLKNSFIVSKNCPDVTLMQSSIQNQFSKNLINANQHTKFGAPMNPGLRVRTEFICRIPNKLTIQVKKIKVRRQRTNLCG